MQFMFATPMVLFPGHPDDSQDLLVCECLTVLLQIPDYPHLQPTMLSGMTRTGIAMMGLFTPRGYPDEAVIC